MASAAMTRLFARILLDRGAAPTGEAELRSLARELGVDDSDVDALLSAEDDRPLPATRLAVYRRLVRNTLSDVTYNLLPRTRARLNEVADAFDSSFFDFLADRGVNSHYLRDVPKEFLSYALPRWRTSDAVPRYLPDLAEFEFAEFSVGAAADPLIPSELLEVGPSRRLVFGAPLTLLRLDHKVHELPRELDNRELAPAAPCSLLLYRDAEFIVRVLTLTPLAHAIMAALIEGQNVHSALNFACQGQRIALDDTVLSGFAALLADLGERGVLVGAA